MSAARGNFLQNMAPNAKRSFFVTMAFGAVGAMLYLFAVEPAGAALAKEQKRLRDAQERQERMTKDLKSSGTVKKRLEEVESAMKPYEDALLVPTLGSYAVCAQNILDPLALGAGLTETSYTEAPFRALPVPKPTMPVQLHTRAAVRMKAKGSYQEAVSFLLRLERDFPFVVVQTMDVEAQIDPARQSVEFVIEWPAKGGKTTPPPGAKKGTRK